MLNFSEYKKHSYLPVVHFDIHRENVLLEELHAYTPPHFLGTIHDLPENNDFVLHDKHTSIYTHPDYSNKYFVFHGSNALPFDSVEDARKHTWNMDVNFRSSTHDIAKELMPQYRVGAYTADQLDAIEKYTKGSKAINTALLTKRLLSTNDKAIVYGMDDALNEVKTPDDMIVYSGTNGAHAKTLSNNLIVEHPAYISTSLNIMHAHRFAEFGNGDIIKIHVPKGFSGLYAQEYSEYPREQEFILPRNLKLKIDNSKKMIFRPSGQYHQYTVHDATIVE
jgi:hypothetical protein